MGINDHSNINTYAGFDPTGYLANPATADLDMADFNIMMGTGGIGNDEEIITFGAGVTGASTFAGNILLGANGIGGDNPILTFAGGAAGAVTSTGVMLFPDGTVAIPSIAFSADTNTGIFRIADDSFSATSGGSEGVRISETGDDITVLLPIALDSVTITNGGTGYAAGDLTFTGGGGTGMAGTYGVTAGIIDSIVITNVGNGYTFAPTIGTSDAGNADAVLAAVMRTNQLMANRGSATVQAISLGESGTGIYGPGINQIGFSLIGAQKWVMYGSIFKGASSNGPALVNQNSSATVPSVTPNHADDNTGIGRADADQLSLIAGGVELQRLTEAVGGNVITMNSHVHYHKHQFDDNFLVTSKNYGSRWDLTNVGGAGTNAIKAGAGFGGITLLTTGATTGNYECTQTEDVFFSRAIAPMVDVHMKLDTDLVGKHVKFGLSDNPMVEDGKYCMFLFDYNVDNVNWWSHSADGIDASLAVGPTAGTSQELRMYVTAAGVAYFYVDDVLKGTVTGAVGDGTPMYLFYGVETEANQAEAIEVDHISASWDTV